MHLRIRRFLPETKVEGPGNRACIWVQGCSIHCPDCVVPESWPTNGGEEIEVEKLAQIIIKNKEIGGVTFSGGEPFNQAEPLAKLGKIIQEHGMSVVTFTGYTLEDILGSNNSNWQNLLKVTDLLIDGPYMSKNADSRLLWVGSHNQIYHFISTRYKHLETNISRISKHIEVRIDRNGQILINGMFNPSDLDKIFEGII